MRPVKIAINGFGRIGRLAFRKIAKRADMCVVAINDRVSCDNLAYLLKYDSTHGTLDSEVLASADSLIVDGQITRVFSAKDPANLPWHELDIDYVIESTGSFTTRDELSKHLVAGAKRVVLSAPAKGDIPMYVMGVNHLNYNNETDFIVSNASCTTNCLAPITKVLLDHFGIEEGLMTTVHALTSSQHIVDGTSRKDWRAGRGASQNIIPSATGAANAVGICIPEVQGKLTGMAFRVPTVDVSVVDLTVRLSRSTTYQEICQVMKQASLGALKGILEYCDQPLVSSDFVGSSFSAIFDAGAGLALNEKFYKIIAWYDNEMGYACRMIDLIAYMMSKEAIVART